MKLWKKFLLLVLVLSFILISGCAEKNSKVKATIKNSTFTMELKLYNGSTLPGTITAGNFETYELEPGTCLTIKKYNFGIYDSTVNECFDSDRTVTII